MAKVLDEFQFQRRGRQSGSQYDKYLDGQIWSIDLADHNVESMEGLRSSLIAAAKRRGMKIRTQKMNNSTLVVQKKEE